MIPFEFIAHIENDYSTKFGIPRQSGLDGGSLSKIVFEKPYRDPSALKGIEGYSHLWLLWYFSEGEKPEKWSPTVRPPRLGGNERMGVFATRSPNRPNRIGLSCVQFDGVVETEDGPVLLVRGADLKSGTPIFDIKPYLPFCDAHPSATGGFADAVFGKKLTVAPTDLFLLLPEEKRTALLSLLAEDPRPSYHHDPDRVYAFEWGGYKIKFTVNADTLYVCEIKEDHGRK